jgi:hypothetical protein
MPAIESTFTEAGDPPMKPAPQGADGAGSMDASMQPSAL